MRSVLLVSGDFTPWGGMDRANYELARYLAEEARVPVRLAAHFVAEPLAGHPNVAWSKVPKPFARHAFGAPWLDREGRRLAGRLEPGSRVIVNGGNCAWPDVNWVHALHAVWRDDAAQASLLYRLRAAVLGFRNRRDERRALGLASLVLANSEQTRRAIIRELGLPEERVRTVYYGVDPQAFRPAAPAERAAARRGLGLPAARPAAAFIGAISPDRRKGFDVVFEAWADLCKDPAWDADLLAAGTGAELGLWRDKAAALGLSERVRLLGFSKQVPDILAASDILVSPTRYEAYGLAVHEALCCGLPAFVTASAGVAERYPADLRDLLLDDPPSAQDLVRRLRAWRADMPGFSARVAPLGASLRKRTWDDMSREIVGLLSDPARNKGRPWR